MRYLVTLACLIVSSESWATLFSDHTILEVTLTGPLSSTVRKSEGSDELPFKITSTGETVNVAVRVRGKSRQKLCRFPPLRLNFLSAEVNGTQFHGLDKLKLVTHCRNGDAKAQDALLNEYASYRLFNKISAKSYRVRLLKITYVDTDEQQKALEAPHFGFLIESQQSLAARLGGVAAEVAGVRFSALDLEQVGRLNMFQYLIGNRDWSFVTAPHEDTCCHNIDLLRVEGTLVPVPYDFDLAALTGARYKTSRPTQQAWRREYRGYCRTPVEQMKTALNHMYGLQQIILTTLAGIPALAVSTRQRRTKFIEGYFEDAQDKDKLLARIEKRCI